MPLRIPFLTWLLGLLAFTTPLWALSPALRIEASVSATTVTVGDPIELTLTISFDPSLKVRKPAPGQGLGSFEIKGYRFEPVVQVGPLAVDRSHYTLAVYETGVFLIPPMRAAAMDGTRLIEVSSEPIKIEIKSLASSRSNFDLSPDRPLELPRGRIAVRYIVYLALPFLLLGAIWGGRTFIKWWRHRHHPPLKPHEKALQDLELLLRQQKYEGAQARAFYFQFSEIARQYLESRIDLPLTTMTTRQILQALGPADSREVRFLRVFLPFADRVKFARHEPESPLTLAQINEFRGLLAEEAARQLTLEHGAKP